MFWKLTHCLLAVTITFFVSVFIFIASSEQRRFHVEKLISNPRGDPSVEYLARNAGYYSLPRSRGARMFYFFFESTNKKDPIVLWLTGGPGAGDEVALLYVNGPVHLADDMSLVWNEYGWNKAASILYVDQPVGSGFSYTLNDNDLCHDEECVSNDLYDFLQDFFKKRSELAKNPFYIAGESYAGHYIPAIASRIHHGNKANQGIRINLKGFAIGNGKTNPEIQYASLPDYALQLGLIQFSDYERITKNLLPECVRLAQICNFEEGQGCDSAFGVCEDMFYRIKHIVKNLNEYDVRKECKALPCHKFPIMEKFLNEKYVRHALGVGNIKFSLVDHKAYVAMTPDRMKNLDVVIPELLDDGIRVLIYAGEFDFICNWLGNWNWVHALKWSGQKQFVGSPKVSFVVDGVEAGEVKSHGPLTFLKVHNAGHMVPMDQPKVSLQMIRSWMSGNMTA